MVIDLPLIWAAIIAFAVIAYVVMDGFDLGIGILFPWFRDRPDRDLMTNSIAPVWDGNETWLVLGGGGLMAAFPAAYATILPALYVPITAMLLALIFRGVAFEFRWRGTRSKAFWDHGFWLGSTVAAAMQGFAVGGLVQGINVENGKFSGGPFDWFSLFSCLTAAAVVVGYALLGATWMVLKMEGKIQAQARAIALKVGAGLLVLIAVVSLWTPFIEPEYYQRWFGWPTILFSGLVPTLVMVAAFLLWQGLVRGKDLQPFLAALALFLLCYAGLGISFYPYMVPGALTIAEAAAPDTSLSFMLVGAAVLIPVIIAYTGYSYWVFRGKMDPEEGYH